MGSDVRSLLSLLFSIPKRRLTQVTALIFSNAYFLSAYSYIPCGFLQCSNCALSTFACPLILIQRAAVVGAMGMFSVMSTKLIASVGGALAMLALFGALFGSWGCGWLCPFGFIQDMLGKIPVKKFTLPGWAGHARLPLFITTVVAIPYMTRSMFFCDLCPPGAINRLWQEAAGIDLFFRSPEGLMALASVGLLVSVLFISVFVQRPFCTLLCPIGGVMGVFNKISGVFLKLDKESCIECNLCKKACPQGLNPAKHPAHTQCSRCFECTKSCEHLKVDIRL
jgi:ferredoxin-type protein NapH